MESNGKPVSMGIENVFSGLESDCDKILKLFRDGV
jgi:hypothetical protein